MVDKQHAIKLAGEKFRYQTGQFYGAFAGLGLGVGLIYDRISYSSFDESEGLFDTVAGLVYVLSHECDIDKDNPRFFNSHVLICPIIDFGILVEDYGEGNVADKVDELIVDLVKDKIFRAIYIPPISQRILPDGGVLYFNQITNTHIASFDAENVRPICALSTYAQRLVDYKLENHLLRPKADALPRLA